MTEQDKDVRKPEPQLSVLSVSRQWWHICVILLCAQTLAWMGFVWWGARSGATDYRELVEAVVYGASRAIPLFIVLAITAVIFAEFAGGLIVVLARYLKHKFEKQAEARGIEMGEQRERSAWIRWYERMKQAEAKGEPFNEPPPSMER